MSVAGIGLFRMRSDMRARITMYKFSALMSSQSRDNVPAKYTLALVVIRAHMSDLLWVSLVVIPSVVAEA